MTPRYCSRLRRGASVLVAVCATALTAVVAPAPAGAVQAPQSVVVNPNPVDWTPHVLDGQVNAIAQVGNTVYLGGIFTRVRPATSTTEVTRTNLVAFNATTGAIGAFAPTFNGEVTTIIPAADGTSIYIGGSFTSVNGVAASSRVVRLDTSTGARVAGFNPPGISGPVRDLRLVGNRLWVAGNFTHVNGVAQPALATLNATTGARDPFMGLRVAGVHNGGTTAVAKIDVTPDGRRLFAIGNFMTLNGQVNDQVFALDISGTSAQPAPWQTTFYNSTCSSSFNTYMRDLDISPDGGYVVFTTTGAYRGTSTSCDTVARFEVGATGTNVRPTWIDFTGGDTTYAVAVTGEAVYIGGHQRWFNNPFASDRAGAGAVSREGIAALDPANGLPLSWNPGRTRGENVFDLLATPAGLWVGSDTDRIGNMEYHARIAFFPVQGGTALPDNQPGRLPGRAYLLGTGTSANVAGRWFDGRVTGPTQTYANGGVAWQSVRGAVMIDGTLYTGLSDGSFVGRSYDGQTFGTPTAVNTSDLIVNDAAWHADVRNVTGMFFSDGRLYYTVAGQTSLFYRYFTPESRVVGAQRFVAAASIPGLSFSTVRTMFVGGGHLYWTTNGNGNLQRIRFQSGVPAGTIETVSGPNVDGVDWSAQEVFLFTGQVPPPNRPPVAVASAACTNLDCVASGAGSTDPDDNITSYSWDFGDGTPATTGVTAPHAYAAKGTYTITLTVADAEGRTSTATATVNVQAAPTASFTATCDSATCSFDASASSDPDGTLTAYSWSFGDGTPAGSGATVEHVYATPGDYTVALTVTDDAGATGTTSQSVHAAPAPAEISYVGGATTSVNSQTHRVNLPATTQAGDGLLLFASSNSVTATMSAPTGGGTWVLLDTVDTGSVVTRVWKAQAGPSPAGATVQVTTGALAKVNLTVLAYRGTAPDPVAAFSRAAETTLTTAHTTPTASVTGPGSWVVSYWAQKDSDTAASPLSGPAAVTSRSAGTGSGAGRVVSLAADSAAPVAQGTAGGHTATAAVAARHATMWTIVLRPA